MQCNIDQRGRMLRLITGVILVVTASILVMLTVFAILPWWGWIAATGVFLGGTFTIFEALQGWCVVRAMGFKTPI